MSNIIDHGEWERYTPSEHPEGAPPHTMFSRRVSDGVDWYEYVNSGKNFQSFTVKAAAIWRDDVSGYVVGPAVHDATEIFPAGHIVVEITNYNGGDPQSYFRNKIFNPETGAFSEKPPMKMPELPPTPSETKILNTLDAIMARLDKLETK